MDQTTLKATLSELLLKNLSPVVAFQLGVEHGINMPKVKTTTLPKQNPFIKRGPGRPKKNQTAAA